MGTYVLVHGGWHTGDDLEETAAVVRAQGHTVFAPTLAGNRPGDRKDIGLDAAIESLVSFFKENSISDAVLLGHSYAGMVITGAADRLPAGSIRRLIYWSAFVPNDGESMADLLPPHVLEGFGSLVQPDGSMMAPYIVYRELFINDADEATAKAVFEKLNPHPFKTITDKISLSQSPAAMQIGKSFLLCEQDTAMPASLPWHPRLSEKLGLFRFVSMPGSHEVCFTNPALLGQKIIEAGRD